MNIPIFEEQIRSYRKKLSDLDKYAKYLSRSEKQKFKAARNRYEQRLDAWQKTLGSDLAVFENNLEEGYHELEAKIINRNR